MATTVVIKVRNGEIDEIISNDEVTVIIAEYGPAITTDPYGESCYVTSRTADEEPVKVGEFEDAVENTRRRMRGEI